MYRFSKHFDDPADLLWWMVYWQEKRRPAGLIREDGVFSIWVDGVEATTNHDGKGIVMKSEKPPEGAELFMDINGFDRIWREECSNALPTTRFGT